MCRHILHSGGGVCDFLPLFGSVLFGFYSLPVIFVLNVWRISVDGNSFDGPILAMNIWFVYAKLKSIILKFNSKASEWIWLRRTRTSCHCYKINKHKWQIDITPVSRADRNMYLYVYIERERESSLLLETKQQRVSEADTDGDLGGTRAMCFGEEQSDRA